MRRPNLIFLVVSLAGLTTTGAIGKERADLASQARRVFQHYCFKCHGKDGSAEGGMDYVVDLAKLVDRGKVKPGQADQSKVIRRLRSRENPMPPDYAQKWVSDAG